MIVKCGWGDNDKTHLIVQFFENCKFINYHNCRFYELDEKYKKDEIIMDIWAESFIKNGVDKNFASIESIKKEERFLELFELKRKPSKEEKKEFCQLLTKRWHLFMKNEHSGEKIENPNFKVVRYVKEDSCNGEVVYCFTKNSGQCITF